MATEERHRPAVGVQIKKWRTERGLTLAGVAERSGLNVGYLSQIENDKASPSLSCLGALAAALEVPGGLVPDRRPARAPGRPGGRAAGHRDEPGPCRACRRPAVPRRLDHRGDRHRAGRAVGIHAHAGEEHHIVLRGRFRMTQGATVIETGPGDYVRWDGTIPHDAELMSEGGGSMLIIRIRPKSPID